MNTMFTVTDGPVEWVQAYWGEEYRDKNRHNVPSLRHPNGESFGKFATVKGTHDEQDDLSEQGVFACEIGMTEWVLVKVTKDGFRQLPWRSQRPPILGAFRDRIFALVFGDAPWSVETHNDRLFDVTNERELLGSVTFSGSANDPYICMS